MEMEVLHIDNIQKKEYLGLFQLFLLNYQGELNLSYLTEERNRCC